MFNSQSRNLDILNIYGSKENDLIYGSEGNDFIEGKEGNDTLYGCGGDDYIEGNKGKDRLYGSEGNDSIYGGEGEDYIEGNEGDDILYGGEGDDHIEGNRGNDLIYGGKGNDLIYGGGGSDNLYGGEGNNIFTYQLISDSLSSSPDMIMDFKTGRDKIDISNLDGIRANFTKIKQVDHFSNQKNEMIVNYNEQDNLTSIMVDCDGNGEAGFKIEVVGVVNHVTDIIMYEGPF